MNHCTSTAETGLLIISGRKGDDERARRLLAVAERSLSRRGAAFPFDLMLLSLTVAEAQLEDTQRALTKLGDGGRAENRLNRLVRHSKAMLRRSDEAAGPATSLSAREPQVLGLLRTGLTLEQIGKRLFISRDTVKTHASQSYRKLGVHGRDEAVTEAERLGIL